jgi:phosphotriesterase-related protein
MRNSTIETVRGPVNATDLGFTTMHEHLHAGGNLAFYAQDFRDKWSIATESIPPSLPVTIQNLGALRRGAWLCTVDHWGTDDPEVMLAEIEAFRARGGCTLVDVSPIGIRGANFAVNLRQIAERANVNIIVSTGLYALGSWPASLRGQSLAVLERTFRREIEVGLDDTGIKAASIKTAINDLNSTDETCAALAAGRVAADTNLPLTVHIGLDLHWATADAVFRILKASGVRPDKVILAHMQGSFLTSSCTADRIVKLDQAVSTSVARRLLDAGFNISIDTFGIEANMSLDIIGQVLDRDECMLTALFYLVSKGYGDRIVLGHDTFSRLQLQAYGGNGLTRVLDYVIPTLRAAGISDAELTRLTVTTPMRLLTR